MKNRICVFLMIFLISCLFISCSEDKKMRQILENENMDIISIKPSKTTNGYWVWFYCDSEEKLNSFFQEYECIDFSDWNYSKNDSFWAECATTFQDDKDIPLKNGFYLKMEVLWDKQTKRTMECELFIIGFSQNVTSKTTGLMDYIAYEYWSGYHQLNKIFNKKK